MTPDGRDYLIQHRTRGDSFAVKPDTRRFTVRNSNPVFELVIPGWQSIHWRHHGSHLFRHVKAVAVVVPELFIKDNFVPFHIDDSPGPVTVSMPLQKYIKTALQGAI